MKPPSFKSTLVTGAPEYRGFGGVGGVPTEAGLAEDGTRAYGGHLRVPVLQAAIPNRSCSTLMLTMCISNWSFAVRAPTSIPGRRSSKSITLF